MKKRLLIALLVAIIPLIGRAAFAIPSFGTNMPKGKEWRHGARGDLIFGRRVESYKEAEISSYHYTLSIGLFDWLCLDGMAGVGTITSEYINSEKLRYTANFSGGYGWRAKIYKNKDWGIDWVIGFQHMSVHPGTRRQVKGRKHEIIWDDWQLSTTVSKKLWRFTPYCGTKWSTVYLISKTDGDWRRKLSKGTPVGLIIGTDFEINDRLFVSAEGRFIDETGLNAGFTFKY